MEPILDEVTLVPSSVRSVSTRVLELARTIQSLDRLGAPRVLRSVRDASDRDISGGRGLRRWCFDPSTDKDAGRLIAKRLSSQPYIDGPGGLFAAAEGTRAVEARVAGVVAFGAGLAAMTDGALLRLRTDAPQEITQLTVALSFLDEEGERSESVVVAAFASPEDVDRERSQLMERIDRSVANGRVLMERSHELFSHLCFGERAQGQTGALAGTEVVFRQLLRHLRALDAGAEQWAPGEPYEPLAVTYSVESRSTLEDGTLGPLRDFPTPSGFDVERWSLHTKLTGGRGARLYFRAVRTPNGAIVLVGYFGDHLPTRTYPT